MSAQKRKVYISGVPGGGEMVLRVDGKVVAKRVGNEELKIFEEGSK
jgi:hypothetical protein